MPQSLRLILVVVQLGAVKICVAAVEALRMKLSLPPKLMLSEFHALLNADVLFCRFLLNLITLCMIKLRVLVLYFSYLTDNSFVY